MDAEASSCSGAHERGLVMTIDDAIAVAVEEKQTARAAGVVKAQVKTPLTTQQAWLELEDPAQPLVG